MGSGSGGGGRSGRKGGGGGSRTDESNMEAWDPDTYQNLGYKGGPPKGKLDSSIFRGASSEKVNVSPEAKKIGTKKLARVISERYNPATGAIHFYDKSGKPTGKTREASPMEKYAYKKGKLPSV